MLGTGVKPLLSSNVIVLFTCSVVLATINSLIIEVYYFLFTLEPRFMLSMSTRRLGDDHSAMIFYYRADGASSLL